MRAARIHLEPHTECISCMYFLNLSNSCLSEAASLPVLLGLSLFRPVFCSDRRVTASTNLDMRASTFEGAAVVFGAAGEGRAAPRPKAVPMLLWGELGMLAPCLYLSCSHRIWKVRSPLGPEPHQSRRSRVGKKGRGRRREKQQRRSNSTLNTLGVWEPAALWLFEACEAKPWGFKLVSSTTRLSGRAGKLRSAFISSACTSRALWDTKASASRAASPVALCDVSRACLTSASRCASSSRALWTTACSDCLATKASVWRMASPATCCDWAARTSARSCDSSCPAICTSELAICLASNSAIFSPALNWAMRCWAATASFLSMCSLACAWSVCSLSSSKAWLSSCDMFRACSCICRYSCWTSSAFWATCRWAWASSACWAMCLSAFCISCASFWRSESWKLRSSPAKCNLSSRTSSRNLRHRISHVGCRSIIFWAIRSTSITSRDWACNMSSTPAPSRRDGARVGHFVEYIPFFGLVPRLSTNWCWVHSNAISG